MYAIDKELGQSVREGKRERERERERESLLHSSHGDGAGWER